MPFYTFLDINTNEVQTHLVNISDYEEFKLSNPHLQRHFEGSSAPIGDPVRLGIRTIDNGFREVLSKIHNSNYKSNLAGKLSRK
jgi:hypothetical protein